MTNHKETEEKGKRECRRRKMKDQGLLVLYETVVVIRTKEQCRISPSHCTCTKQSSHTFSCRNVVGYLN